MLSLDELGSIYDKGTSQEQGPGPKPLPSLADADKRVAPSPVTFGSAKPVDVREYGRYLSNGVYSDQDIDSQRGQHQSVIEKLGHGLGNLPLNVVGSFIEGIGDIGLLAGQWGDDRTYTNSLIEAGQQLHDITGEIYMTNPHQTVGSTLSDPGWWISQAEGLAELGVSYAALGAGVGGTLSKLTEGTASLLKAGKLGMQTARALGQLGTAGFMSYTMGAQNAGEVFKQTYETQFRHFLDAGQEPDEAAKNAKHIAAQSAATTAQLTTAIGTVLGLGAMAPYFRKADNVALDLLKKKVPQEAGETADAWLSRVKSLNPDDYKSILNPSASWTSKLAEAGKMGVEMQQLQFGQKTGEELGRKGKVKGFLDQFGELDHYMDRTMDKDGALAFAIGVAGGMITHKLTNDVIPSRWADKLDPITGDPIPKVNENGEIVGTEKRLYTPRALSEMHTEKAFSRMRDAIASDIENYNKMQNSYLAAVKANDPVAVDKASQEMFNVNNVNGIINGLGDMWKQTYEGLSNLSPEEAQQRGFISDPKDHQEFVDKAQKAASNMDKYQKIYDDLQDRYGTLYDQNAGYKPVVDGLFSRKVHLDAWDNILQEHESKIKEMNANEEKILIASDPDLFEEHTSSYTRAWDAAQKNIQKLKQDWNNITKSSEQMAGGKDVDLNKNKLLAYAREYSAIEEGDLGKSMSNLADKIDESVKKQQKAVKDAQDLLFSSTGFLSWQERHPEGTFNEFMDEIQKQMGTSDYQHQVELSREKYNISKRNMAEIEKEKNLHRFATKYNKYLEDEVRKSTEFEKKQNQELAERTKGKRILGEAEAAQRRDIANRFKKVRDEHIKAYDEEKERLDGVKKELERIANVKDFVRKSGLRGQQRSLEKKLAEHKALIDKYDRLFKDHDIPNPPMDEPTSVDDVTTTPQFEDTTEQETIPTPYVDQHDVMFNEITESYIDSNTLHNSELHDVVTSLNEAHTKLEEKEGALMDALTEHFNIMDVMEGVNNAYNQIVNEGNFSYDLLNPIIAEGKLTQEQTNKILQSFKEYADAVQEANDKADLIGYNSGVVEVEEEEADNAPTTDTIDIDPPTDIPTLDFDPNPDYTTNNDELPNETPDFGPDEEPWDIGDKTVDANTIANSTLGFGNLSKTGDDLASVPDAVNQKTNPDVLKAGKLRAGHPLRFEVDTEYNGRKTKIGGAKGSFEQESFSDYVDSKGKVPADKMANVPIKIVDAKTGKTIGYVRKHEWITERKDGKLRNIASKYNKDTGEEYNGALQSKNILNIRKQIVDQFNANGKGVQGKIKSKGVGHAILNREGFKPKPGYAFNKKDTGLLPDPKIKIGLVNNGTMFTGKGNIFDKGIAGETDKLPNGSVYALLPGANGVHVAAPLIGPRLDDNAHGTISRAIEMYLSYNGAEENPVTHEIQTLQDKTGHDVSTESGLRNFINQYFTHLQSFTDTATLSTGKGRTKFLFNVWDKIASKEGKAWIKAGWSESNQKPIHASLDENGKLSQEFSELLRAGLATRTKSVVFTREGIRGINEERNADRSFTDAQYINGRWVHNTYSDYNEYVKSFSKTTVFGRNKVGKDYVYTANPSIHYELETPQQRDIPTNIVVENNTTKVNLEPKQDKYAEFERKDYERKLPEYQARRQALKDIVSKSVELGGNDKLREWIGTAEAYDFRNRIQSLFSSAYPTVLYNVDDVVENLKHLSYQHQKINVDEWLRDMEKKYGKPTPIYDQSLANELDDIFDSMPAREEKRDEIGTGTDKSRPLDLKTLEELYTFTPEEQRNGKVPSDVLKELTDRGHSFLPDGYNPFSLCL